MTGAAASIRARSSLVGQEGGRKEHRDRSDALQDGAVGETRGDPCGLLRGQEIVGGFGFDLNGPLERIFELVQVVGMPTRDQVGPVVDVGAGSHFGLAPHVDEPLVWPVQANYWPDRQ